jgi:putative flippase GtrA
MAMSSVPEERTGFGAGRIGLVRRLAPATQAGHRATWARLNRGLRRRENWRQLTLFCLVGGSGYIVNLAVFALCVQNFRLDPHDAAVIAFICAASNNLVWNRRWTFPRRGSDLVREARRFFVVSIAAFLLSLSILSALVDLAVVPPIVAQLISIVVATPVSFAGNKLWTFRQGGPITRTGSINAPAGPAGTSRPNT